MAIPECIAGMYYSAHAPKQHVRRHLRSEEQVPSCEDSDHTASNLGTD